MIDLDSNFRVTAARRAAFDVLRRVETENAYAGNLLTSSRYQGLSREDHALAQELTLGVLRWQGLLDYLIKHHAQRSLDKLDLEVIIALRMGLYQLRSLSRIPPHAAINESVNLVKGAKKSSAAPFVNAVLRSAQRERDLEFPSKDPGERLVLETSHPSWLIRRWLERFGEEETRALALANNQTPRVAFRFNLKQAPKEATRTWFNEHGIETRQSELTPGAEIIADGSLASELVRNGWIYLQDEASQLVAHLIADLAERAGERESGRAGQAPILPHSPTLPLSPALPLSLLDLCGAPGSKTTLLASLLPENSLIVAGDYHLHRLRTMKELISRLESTAINLVQLDAAGRLPFPQPARFDFVLLDAPCSGLGTLQRNPEIKWRMNAAKVLELAELQERMLINAASQVRAGGLLAYSVCSTELEEGEEVIARFRRGHPEFRDLTRERLSALGLDPQPLLTASFGARTFPHRHGTEGFFVCVLWRRR